MAHLKKEWAPQPIGKYSILLMIFLVFTLSLSTGILANEEYKIISFKGKVKVKKNDEVVQLKKQLHLYLKKNEAVMLYPKATIEIVFPDGKNKTFTGPFYSTIKSLEKPFDRNRFSFFGKPEQWKSIERIFEEEGENPVDIVRGSQEDSLNFYDEIKPMVATVRIEDKAIEPNRQEKMKKILETVEPGFNAFPKDKQMVIRSLVYKFFGWHKTALDNIFAHYRGILHTKGKQAERELIEDYLFFEFLPIVILSRPNNESDPSIRSSPGSQDIHFNKIFYSNVRLWWAAFSFNGRELETIGKTLDYSLHPENTFRLNKKVTVNNRGNGNTGPGQVTCFYIVACTDWTLLEKFDDMEYARKVLLDNPVREIGSTPIQDYGKVIIKRCL